MPTLTCPGEGFNGGKVDVKYTFNNSTDVEHFSAFCIRLVWVKKYSVLMCVGENFYVPVVSAKAIDDLLVGVIK